MKIPEQVLLRLSEIIICTSTTFNFWRLKRLMPQKRFSFTDTELKCDLVAVMCIIEQTCAFFYFLLKHVQGAFPIIYYQRNNKILFFLAPYLIKV